MLHNKDIGNISNFNFIQEAYSRVISKSNSTDTTVLFAEASKWDLYKFIVNKTEEYRFYLARSIENKIKIYTPDEKLICSIKKNKHGK